MSETLSANQLWKSSGTSLPFKDWLQREKDKGTFIKNEVLSSAIEDSKRDIGISESANNDTYNQQQSNKIFGLNKYVVYGSAALITAAILYKYFKK